MPSCGAFICIRFHFAGHGPNEGVSGGPSFPPFLPPGDCSDAVVTAQITLCRESHREPGRGRRGFGGWEAEATPEAKEAVDRGKVCAAAGRRGGEERAPAPLGCRHPGRHRLRAAPLQLPAVPLPCACQRLRELALFAAPPCATGTPPELVAVGPRYLKLLHDGSGVEEGEEEGPRPRPRARRSCRHAIRRPKPQPPSSPPARGRLLAS